MRTHLGSRKVWQALAFTFVLLAIVAYWPAFFSELIWDDHFLISKSPFFRSPALLLEAFQHWLYPFSVSEYFRPVQNVSYMVNYWLWGEKIFWYHLTNALLHACAAFVLAKVVLRVANKIRPSRERANSWLAWCSAAIWLVHPIHHAAVAYTAGRADSLAAVFALLSWLLVEKGLEREGTARALLFCCAVVSCLLALFSKEIAITWIVLFVAFQICFALDRTWRSRITLVISAVIVVGCYFLYRQSLPVPPETGTSGSASPLYARLGLVLRALGDYLSIIFLPVNLHMERQLHVPTDVLRSSAPWLYYHAKALVPLALGGAAAALWLCFRKGENRRLNAFACCWFLVGFFPISNLLPLNAPVAEHWIYMPSAGVVLLVVNAVLGTNPLQGRLRLSIVGGVVVVLTALTHEQSRTWLTEELMFGNAISRGGDIPRARANLARVLEAKGKNDEAEEVLRAVLQREPENPNIVLQLSSLLQRLQRNDEVEKLLLDFRNSSTSLPPRSWTLSAHQVRLLVAEKKIEEAESVLSEALQRWPGVWDLVYLQALVSAEAGFSERSIRVLGEYVSENWWHRDAVIVLARYLADAGRYDEAIDKYRLAGKLDIRNAKPWEQISAIHATQGKLPDALKTQEKAVRIEPKSVEQRLRLAAIHKALGNEVEAFIEEEKARELAAKKR